MVVAYKTNDVSKKSRTHLGSIRKEVKNLINRRQRPKLRKKIGFPQPRQQKRTAIIQTRVTPETKAVLEWAAVNRREPLGSMTHDLFGLAAYLLMVGRHRMEKAGIVTRRPFAFSMSIVGGGLDSPVSMTLVTPQTEAENEIELRLRKLYSRFDIDVWKIMTRDHPILGCSIVQAIKELRFKEVDRVIRKLEREVKPPQPEGGA